MEHTWPSCTDPSMRKPRKRRFAIALLLLLAIGLKVAFVVGASPRPQRKPSLQRRYSGLEAWDGKLGVGAVEEWGVACQTQQGQALEELVKSSVEADEEFQTLVDELLLEEDSIGSGLEGALAKELLERRRADLLYLNVVRKYKSLSVPGLKTFDLPDNRTWVMSGGAAKWMEVAKDLAFGIYMPSFNESVQRAAGQAVVGDNEGAKRLLGTYFADLVAAANGLAPSEDSALSPFLLELRKAIGDSTFSVGGASGLPDRNRTLEEAPVPLPSLDDPPKDEVEREWFDFYAEVLDNTRVAQADIYLSHVYFGICLQGLARRFQLAQMAGLLPELSEVELQRARLESSLGSEDPKHLDAERFREFAESQDLSEVLAVSPTMLAAARRHTEAVFGRGLREELFKILEEASKASAALQQPSVETCSKLMVNAAATGELRMISAGPMARERLAWDGVFFGAMLQDSIHVVGGGPD